MFNYFRQRAINDFETKILQEEAQLYMTEELEKSIKTTDNLKRQVKDLRERPFLHRYPSIENVVKLKELTLQEELFISLNEHTDGKARFVLDHTTSIKIGDGFSAEIKNIEADVVVALLVTKTQLKKEGFGYGPSHIWPNTQKATLLFQNEAKTSLAVDKRYFGTVNHLLSDLMYKYSEAEKNKRSNDLSQLV